MSQVLGEQCCDIVASILGTSKIEDVELGNRLPFNKNKLLFPKSISFIRNNIHSVCAVRV